VSRYETLYSDIEPDIIHICLQARSAPRKTAMESRKPETVTDGLSRNYGANATKPKLLLPVLRNALCWSVPRVNGHGGSTASGGGYSLSGTAKMRPKMGANRSNTSAKTSSGTLS
jgi:hypothetical protein